MTETILTKDTILVNIGDDHSFNCAATTLGRSGENNISQLEITIPEELATFDAYLDFKKQRGETVRTPKLAIENNKIEYDMPLSLLDQSGSIEVQVILQDERGYIWKSVAKKFSILKSVNAVEDIPEKEDFITEAQNLLDEMTAAIGDIDTALGSIIAIQESLINGTLIKFTIATVNDQQGQMVYYAKEGMTWAEWCGSEYDTLGVEIKGNGLVIYKASGGYVWIYGGEMPEAGTNTIIADGRYHAE